MALKGAAELVRQLKLADPGTHAAVARVIQQGTEAVAGAARSSAPKVTGEMASTIRAEYSADHLTGFVRVGFGKMPRRSSVRQRLRAANGYRRRRALGPGGYAPVIEHGDPRRHHIAEPFLSPSLQSKQPQIRSGLDRAMDGVCEDIAR
jgi:hypothetical protein